MNKEIKYNSFVHSGGEIHINLEEIPESKNTLIRADLNSSEDIMKLFMVTNAIDNRLDTYLTAYIPYFPYARADRVIKNGGGDSFGCKVMANLINSQHYDKVIVLDPHSYVVEACLDRCIALKPYKLIEKAIDKKAGITFVSPDAGAEKRVFEYAKKYGANFVRATKNRDLTTGEIKSVTLIDSPEPDQYFYIIDDICDGGKTFIELAKVLPMDGPKYLVVTHGIFSKGFKELNKYYEHIYTTDSFPNKENKNLTVMDCNEFLTQ